MPSLEDILAILREQHTLLSQRYPIQRLALFGSWARGDARENSDVDVMVEVDPSIGLRFVDLGEELEKALGRRVDLVSRRAIKPSLWERIEPELIDAYFYFVRPSQSAEGLDFGYLVGVRFRHGATVAPAGDT